jgi:FtsP/CotA-like multicopper oxidase with cupredoxin domain
MRPSGDRVAWSTDNNLMTSGAAIEATHAACRVPAQWRAARRWSGRRGPTLQACSVSLVMAALGWSGPASARDGTPQAVHEFCSRPAPGSLAPEPEDLRSENGVLKVDLTVRNEKQADGSTRYCYVLGDGNQSPTLRLKPGELLILSLRNQLSDMSPAEPAANSAHAGHEPTGHEHPARDPAAHQHTASKHPVPDRPGAQHAVPPDPCTSGVMTLTSTNLHFHGLTLPPVCHQDEVFKTSIQPTDPPFEYRFRIPIDEPPGLYWYHPHIHGFSSQQVLGGASGALIVEGIERANPEVAALPERVLVIRDQDLLHPQAPPSTSQTSAQALIDRDGDAVNTGTGTGRPAKDLSVNFVPVPYPDYPTTTVAMKPGEKQLWRVVNASSVTYLNLAALYKRGPRFRPQWIGVVAIDGVPMKGNGSPSGHGTEWRDSIVVSPGARVEFIMVGPPAGAPAMLVTKMVNTGPGGENDPNRPLISIVATADAASTHSTLPAASGLLPAPALPWLGNVAPVRVRKLYFSEDVQDPNDPNSPTKFYLTVDGQTPATFDPASETPNIVVRQGDVEDWIIENRSTELHAFHIHQIHFEVVEWLGLAVNEPYLRDTVNIPFYSPSTMQNYPAVRLRMDFRDPNTVGTFVYHCHLLDHEDGGMMGLIRVEPANNGYPSSHTGPSP